MKIILLSLLTTILMVSCYNEDTQPNEILSFTSHVISEETKEPLENIKVYLTGYGHGKIDSTFTDKNGKFIFNTFRRGDIEDYYILISGFPKYQIGGHDPFFKSDTIFLIPNAWLTFTVKNINPYNENDEIRIDYKRGEKIIRGSFVETTFSIPIEYKNGYPNLYSYYYKKNNKYFSFKENISLKSFDTVRININY